MKKTHFETLTSLDIFHADNQLLYVVIVIQLHNHELLFVVKLTHKEWLPFLSFLVRALGMFLNLVDLLLLLAHSVAPHEFLVRNVLPLAFFVFDIVLHASQSR